MNDPRSSDKWGPLTDEKPETTYPVITQPVLATLLWKRHIATYQFFFFKPTWEICCIIKRQQKAEASGEWKSSNITSLFVKAQIPFDIFCLSDL